MNFFLYIKEKFIFEHHKSHLYPREQVKNYYLGIHSYILIFEKNKIHFVSMCLDFCSSIIISFGIQYGNTLNLIQI